MSEITFLSISVCVLVLVGTTAIWIVSKLAREIESILADLDRHNVKARIIEKREGGNGSWAITWTCSECGGGVHRDDSFCKHCGKELVGKWAKN